MFASRAPFFLPALLLIGSALLPHGTAGELAFRTEELPTRLGVGYAVRLLDMNADARLDIAIVDRERIVWLENPKWNEHVLIEGATKKDNVCFAPADIDGDGRLDFAVGADWTLNTERGGTIEWITGGQEGEPWQVFPIGEEPTVHRMRFADLDGDKRPELIVLPLLGRSTTRPHFAEKGVNILLLRPPADPKRGRWRREVIDDGLHVTHNFWPTDLDGDGRTDLLVVSFEGVSLLQRKSEGGWQRTLIGRGNQETSPNKGASEIKHGRLRGGDDYLATIEPWHGHQVVVYTRPETEGKTLWRRQVLDEDLKWGHAVWCANLDDDADEELIVGVRDDKSDTARRGLRLYDPGAPGDAEGKTWRRTLVDPGGVAIEDLAAADLDADGDIDIVAVGRQTHNVRIYWNKAR